MEIESKISKPVYRFAHLRMGGRVQEVFGPEIDDMEFHLECWHPDQPQCLPRKMELFTGKQARKLVILKEKWSKIDQDQR